MTCPHTRWIVNRQGAATFYLFLSCEECDTRGYVQDPTSEEWALAYYAAEHPYTWDGGNERVMVIEPAGDVMLPGFEETK